MRRRIQSAGSAPEREARGSRWGRAFRGGAFSLIELLCVMAIVSILAGLLLGAVGRAYQRARRFAAEMNEPAYMDQIRARTIAYARREPRFPRLTLDELVRRCDLDSRCAAFLRSAEVRYIPFSSQDPEDQAVIIHMVGKGKDATANVYSKGWLCKPDND